METKNHLEGAARFFDQAIKELANGNLSYKVLDFGCGSGQLVRELSAFGYTVYGCDVVLDDDNKSEKGLLRKIEIQPYKLPYENNQFDIVVSTSVLEHAQNTEECFQEIARVLKPGGYALHLLPGKFYLPTEPHIFVPLVSWFWPRCPNWWLALWAFLGIRNEFQKGLSWKQTYSQNKSYVKKNLCYKSTKYYEILSKEVFGQFLWPMVFYINHANGGFCRLARKLPFKGLSGILSRELRMGFLVTQKVK
jgi:SAM-dependent methyltransferase